MHTALMDFQDGETGIIYDAGDTVDVSGMSESRIKALATSDNALGYPLIAGLVEAEPEVVEEPEAIEVEAEPELTEVVEEPEVEAEPELSYAELKEQAAGMGLEFKHNISKADLIELITAAVTE